MRHKIINTWLACLLVLLAITACDGDAGGVGEKAQFVFKLELPPALEVTTRAETTTNPSLDGITIENVWVVQYNATGGTDDGNFLKAACFTSGGTLSLEGKILTVDTQGADFSSVSSRFYVIVNAGSNFLDNFIKEGNTDKSETALQAMQVSLTNIADNIKAELKLMAAGPLDYTPGSDGKVVLTAPLNRAYAKVSVKWVKNIDAPGTFDITGMDIYNLPSKMALYTRGGGSLSSTYPTLDADITAGPTAVATTMSSGTDYYFWMPENLRGMGTAPSFAEKGLKKYGPTKESDGSSSLKNCTYLVLKGTYKYDNMAADVNNTIAVEYHIYLGTNLKTDYNIQRGFFYQLTLKLSGANTGDVRVRITDGRVVVFDKVEKIEHEIEFGDEK